MSVGLRVTMLRSGPGLASVYTGLEQRLQDAARQEAEEIVSDIRADMAAPKHGQTYLVRLKNGGAKLHRASEPGESPAIVSGELAASVATKPSGRQSWTVFSTHRLARMWEFGGRRMAARPFLAPAIRRARKRRRFNERVRFALLGRR